MQTTAATTKSVHIKFWIWDSDADIIIAAAAAVVVVIAFLCYTVLFILHTVNSCLNRCEHSSTFHSEQQIRRVTKAQIIIPKV